MQLEVQKEAITMHTEVIFMTEHKSTSLGAFSLILTMERADRLFFDSRFLSNG
jgi:hypothetical protein